VTEEQENRNNDLETRRAAMLHESKSLSEPGHDKGASPDADIRWQVIHGFETCFCFPAPETATLNGSN
jgi:hypothetical protein